MKIKSLSFVLVLVLCVSVLAGCGEKTAVTTIDFESKLTEKGYNVNVAAPSNTPCITSVARKNNYDILFYEFVADSSDTSEAVSDNTVAVEYAQKFFDSIKNEFDNRENSKFMSVKMTMTNSAYYFFSASEKFYIISRVGNTVMVAVVPEEHTDEVKAVFEELGYK